MNLNISREWLLRMAEKEGNGIVSVGGLVSRLGPPLPMADAERLAMAGDCVHTTLGRIEHFPCRMDEMTEREAKIAGMVCELVGTLQFLGRVLPEPEPKSMPPEPTP